MSALSKFKSTSLGNKITFVIMGLLTCTVLVMLPIAILTHEEAGLMTACPGVNGAYNYEGTCFSVTWSRRQIPLRVSVYSDNPHPPRNPETAVKDAISSVNSNLGFEALEFTSQSRADIRVALEVPQDVHSTWIRDSGGGALHHMDNGIIWCEIRTWNSGTVEMVDKVLVHELGHCLGLAHDDFRDSAMYPEVVPDEDGELTRLRFTDHDRALLRGLYAP